jgi:hypothetical protein
MLFEKPDLSRIIQNISSFFKNKIYIFKKNISHNSNTNNIINNNSNINNTNNNIASDKTFLYSKSTTNNLNLSVSSPNSSKLSNTITSSTSSTTTISMMTTNTTTIQNTTIPSLSIHSPASESLSPTTPSSSPSSSSSSSTTTSPINNYSTYMQPIIPYITPVLFNENVISSIIDMNIIDTILIENNKENRNENYLSICESFYNKQLEYTNLKNTLAPYIYNEFEKIIMGILNTDHIFLSNLSPIKKYSNDLVNIYTRYGVFETHNFIIKIDNSPEIFNSELEVMLRIGSGIIKPHNIVLPYFVKIAAINNKKKTMHFSVQPLIKNTIALHKWIDLRDNKYNNIETYIQMCISISKSILFMHTHELVHGDIKPDNILIEKNTNIPYIIDFGLSGLQSLSVGTGGTKPFCCPETKNTSMINDKYEWTENKKHFDLWSIAFIFSTIIIFKTCYNYYCHYPIDYFTKDKYVKPKYLLQIPEPFRDIFMTVLCKKTDINLSNFIRLLEDALAVSITV